MENNQRNTNSDPSRSAGQSRRENTQTSSASRSTASGAVTPSGSGSGAARTAARRRRKKKSFVQKFFGFILYLLCIVLISVVISYFAIDVGNDMFGFVKQDKEVTVTVGDKQDVDDISGMLKQSGIIRHPKIFSMYVSMSKSEDDIHPGDYTLNTNMTYSQVVGRLTANSRTYETVRVTIKEGMMLSEIIELLAENGVATAEDLKKTADTYDYSHEFLKEVPKRANRLEGYLFPDTYEFYIDDNPVQVFNKMLNNFAKKYTSALKQRAEEMDMTMDEVIILASMIEGEAAKDSERPYISAVFHNRLKANSQYPYLQSDATVVYAVGERRVLSTADLEIDSPYNTYVVKGLPAGPICSPGLSSIYAALDPADSSYMFFIANAEGTESYFAKNYDQHQANIAKVKKEREELEKGN